MTKPKFPHVRIKLAGEDGNAFAIMGRVQKAMRKGGCSEQDVDRYVERAMSGDYDDLLCVTMETVSCDAEACEDCGDFPCTC